MNILIIEARYYEDISDSLLEGAVAALQKVGAKITKLTVPGALEIPHAIAYAEAGERDYDGYVGLGCVIRGETTHYDYVCGESARALMDLAIDKCLVIGNGIITVENEEQAWARAKVDQKDKGGFAANAVIKMINVRKALAEKPAEKKT
ncbi:6,7-dimethyl-8-ribityllumazine synthase [Litorimonas taeanensis]|uniref:6,7-dimethyl-8-ribityllumazine synthase n=1 Tax=Litorimonas taeanensis TaxID=568099 RepID=A0A420WK89_9PROT|nr:6,7-dimethyl-8-ribityllumazine synthase [Litorimonas taeanensis]RKQ71427.1 6,7-dimethyl-8-ribityllumazine synthase [Litorimonas taeanensis]